MTSFSKYGIKRNGIVIKNKISTVEQNFQTDFGDLEVLNF